MPGLMGSFAVSDPLYESRHLVRQQEKEGVPLFVAT
jgi:hypothetical protein